MNFLHAAFDNYIPCLCHVWTIHRRCPANRRQWADFLVSLRAPLHRQYKTARTETRWHLLLKTGQMPIQTSASRGYVLFSGANKGHSQKSLNCLRLADTPPECSKLGKTQIITAGKSDGVRNSVFCDQNPPACFRWNTGVTLFNEDSPVQPIFAVSCRNICHYRSFSSIPSHSP